MDELWSYVGNKSHQLWVFIAIDTPIKFWINFELGSRTNNTAGRLVMQLKRFGNWTNGTIVKFTTDKLAAYKNALNKYFVEITPETLNKFSSYKKILVQNDDNNSGTFTIPPQWIDETVSIDDIDNIDNI